MRKINKIIVHCSDSPDFRDIGVDEIRRWHVDGNGWSDIGYHFVITRSAQIQIGRSVDVVGAHTRGQNADSIGVCWVGRDKPTDAQYMALVGLIVSLLEKFSLDKSKVMGHFEYDNKKTCPNLDMEKLRREVSEK